MTSEDPPQRMVRADDGETVRGGESVEAAPARRSQQDRATERRIHGAFAVSLLCMGAIAIVAHQSIRQLGEDTRWVEHTHQVLHQIAAVEIDIAEAQNRLRAVVVGGDVEQLAAFWTVADALSTDVERARAMTADNPRQQASVHELGQLANAYLTFARKAVAGREESGVEVARARFLSGEGDQIRRQARAVIERMRHLEEQLLALRRDHAQRSARLTDAVIVAGGTLAVLLITAASLALRRDLTGRRRAEDALRASEENLEATLQSLSDAVVATDTSGRVTRMNRVAETLAGMSFASAQGQPLDAVLRVVDERSGAPLVLPAQTVMSGHTADLASGPVAIVARDGSRRSVAERAAPVRDRRGGVIGVVWILRDVTAQRAAEAKRKQAEDELERFFTLSLDFLTIAGADGYFKRVSRGVVEVLGWTPEEFVAQPYLDLVHPEDRAATIAEARRQVERGEKVMHFENRYRHKDGSYRVLSWRSVPHAGGLMYGAARDITERRRVEEEIRRLNADLRERAAQLETAHKELESFSYSVSHDLRAPLRHIQGYVEMLERELAGTLEGDARRFLTTIGKSANRMNDLIEHLLAFAKMGRVELQNAKVDVAAVVEEARLDLEIATNGRNIRWVIGALPSVQGDRALLKQVFANLISNAIKYSRPRDPAEIEIGQAGEEGGRVVLFVRDNGVGFEMRHAQNLFGVFQRLHRPGEFEGTGIGLANVHRIITRHGGRIWADAKANVGATFFFTMLKA